LEIELSDFEEENTTVKGDCLRRVFVIEIGGIPNIHEIHYMCLFMSLGRILLNGIVLRNMFNPVTHQVGVLTVEVGIKLVGNINLVARIILPAIHFTLLD
jgi:hypothetical protein